MLMTEYLSDQDVMLSAIDRGDTNSTAKADTTVSTHTPKTHATVDDTLVHDDIGVDVKVNNEKHKAINDLINKESNDNNEVIVTEFNDESFMLTTIDNPYNPKTHYEMWQIWERDNGYDTESYIARLVSMEEDYDVDDEFTLNFITTRVIESILENDTLEIYKLV